MFEYTFIQGTKVRKKKTKRRGTVVKAYDFAMPEKTFECVPVVKYVVQFEDGQTETIIHQELEHEH